MSWKFMQICSKNLQRHFETWRYRYSQNHLVLDKMSSSISDYNKTIYRKKRSENFHLESTSYNSPPTILTQSTSKCACATNHLRDGDGSRSRAREGLDSNDLVVEVLVGEAVLGPGVEVVGSGDGTGSTLVLTDRPVLGEGGGTSDLRKTN